jgi:hypothetical protein
MTRACSPARLSRSRPARVRIVPVGEVIGIEEILHLMRARRDFAAMHSEPANFDRNGCGGVTRMEVSSMPSAAA